MTRRSTAAIFVVLAFLAGSILGWFAQRRRSERQSESVAVVQAVEVAGLCANGLQVTEEGKTAALQKLLEVRVAKAVNYAAERVDDASPVGFPVPNLVEGLNRVRRYAVATGMSEVVEKCDRLIEFLAP
jgi:hypothetical protein